MIQQAGFGLVRLFGSDSVNENIVRLASSTAGLGDLKFHLGISVEPTDATCDDAGNAAQIALAIQLAKTYPSIAVVSVGNETSLSGGTPISCLASYVQQVRAAVTQPITADEYWWSMPAMTRVATRGPPMPGASPARITRRTPCCRGSTSSDRHIPLSDLDYGKWNWQQTAVPAGPQRAGAMMNASLAFLQSASRAVARYSYTTAAGTATTIGASLPITIGETGWKATPTDPTSAIEEVSDPAIANPVNQKMYLDLLGTWKGAGAPVTVFYFEAFDEAWKMTDDGWGLWDKTRTPRYALCGLPGEAACNPAPNLYAGAGYYH